MAPLHWSEAQWRWIPRLLSLGIFLFSAADVKAQSATVVESTSSGRGFTASNSSGMSFNANGTFLYDGPLNALQELPYRAALTLGYDGQQITVSADDVLIQTRMPNSLGPGVTLSSDIVQGELPIKTEPQLIQIGYGQILPAITRVSGSNSTTRFELMDGQSLSIFPSFSPSVFP